MEQFIGTSAAGKIEEAVSGIKNPNFIILISGTKDSFKMQVQELERTFPGIPSIGCVAKSYHGPSMNETGITVTAFSGNVQAVTGIMTHVSTMPMKCIAQFQRNMQEIGGDKEHTVCIDYCCANDECVLASFKTVLSSKDISITGGTAPEDIVSCNGTIYHDACCYAFVKNNDGKLKVYKENIYLPTTKKHIVTKAIPSKYIICEFDGKPAEDIYAQELKIAPTAIIEQTFQNPLGRMVGNNIFITSLRERMNNKTFSCYRKINPKDKICILELGNYEAIIQDTIHQIEQDFPKRSGILSVNCILRYLFFEQRHFTSTYLSMMDVLGPHSGLIVNGEHFNNQHANQTMSCVVFE